MNSYRFEIVECAFDRYSWILVVYRGGRRRVIAQAYRDYRSPRKAARAAEELQNIVGKAEIVYAFPQVREYTFKILRDVVPLPVGSVESAEDCRPQPPQNPVTLSSAVQRQSPAGDAGKATAQS